MECSIILTRPVICIERFYGLIKLLPFLGADGPKKLIICIQAIYIVICHSQVTGLDATFILFGKTFCYL